MEIILPHQLIFGETPESLFEILLKNEKDRDLSKEMIINNYRKINSIKFVEKNC